MIFGHNYFISEPIFKLFVTLFRTQELQKDDMVIFCLWCFRKVRFRKMQFLKDGVQTVAPFSKVIARVASIKMIARTIERKTDKSDNIGIHN